jgi:ribonuclease HI/uncharacterized phage-like protein YoqJ
MSPVLAYTDGACSGNPGPGGWAWAIEDGPYKSGYAEHTTNQRMEIMAAFEAVKANPDGELVIVSDSTYVVNCFRDSWHVGWKKRGWTNSQKKPVANRDLWEPFIELVLERGNVRFDWVKGHGTDRMNDLVDRLAVQAITEQKGRSGTGRPKVLGPPDKPAPRKPTVAGPRLPDGHLIMVTGLRPPQLGGYEPNETWDRVRAKLVEALAWQSVEQPDAIVVSGMGLGVEQLAAEAALEAGMPFVAVLPFPGIDGPWSADARSRFRSLVDRSLMEVVYDDREPTSKQGAGAALSRRDAWLARQASSAIVVHDGDDERTEKALRSLVLQLGDESVLEIVV